MDVLQLSKDHLRFLNAAGSFEVSDVGLEPHLRQLLLLFVDQKLLSLEFGLFSVIFTLKSTCGGRERPDFNEEIKQGIKCIKLWPQFVCNTTIEMLTEAPKNI